MSSFLFLLLLPVHISSYIVTQHVYLNPSNENINDAKIIRLGNGLSVVDTGNNQYWDLYATNNQGFNLQLSLGQYPWAFHPTEVTTITILIESTDCLPSCSGKDIMIAFTQKNSNKFFVTVLQIDESGDHLIWPSCDTTSPYNTQYETGNIKNMIDAYNNNYDRIKKATNNDANIYDNFFASGVSYPLQLTLENHPGSPGYMLFSYKPYGGTSSVCGYVAMQSDVALEVYIAAEDAEENFIINSMNVTKIYDQPTTEPSNDPTKAPTTNPSKYPTDSPSSNPSKLPTQNPTDIPSYIPSKVPSNNPSKIPTIYPTMIPSIYPTMIPSKTPSNNPSKIATIYPTISPSIFPSKIPSKSPINFPTNNPSFRPTINPSNNPTKTPTAPTSREPSKSPTENPSKSPTNHPIIAPTNNPSNVPSNVPSLNPTNSPTKSPSINPTKSPSNNPSKIPTKHPTATPITSAPTDGPTKIPSFNPTIIPTNNPSISPTTPSIYPTHNPSLSPTERPSFNPSTPSIYPTNNPSLQPTPVPTDSILVVPKHTESPTNNPSLLPTKAININPSNIIDRKTTSGETSSDSQSNVLMDNLLDIVLIILLAVIIVLCVYCIYYMKHRTKAGKRKNEIAKFEHTLGTADDSAALSAIKTSSSIKTTKAKHLKAVKSYSFKKETTGNFHLQSDLDIDLESNPSVIEENIININQQQQESQNTQIEMTQYHHTPNNRDRNISNISSQQKMRGRKVTFEVNDDAESDASLVDEGNDNDNNNNNNNNGIKHKGTLNGYDNDDENESESEETHDGHKKVTAGFETDGGELFNPNRHRLTETDINYYGQ